MSPREQVQLQLLEFLRTHRRTFDAPYGILDGVHTMKSGGKFRVVVYGVCRHLDAQVAIFSPTDIRIKSNRYSAKCRSVAEAIAFISEQHCLKPERSAS